MPLATAIRLRSIMSPRESLVELVSWLEEQGFPHWLLAMVDRGGWLLVTGAVGVLLLGFGAGIMLLQQSAPAVVITSHSSTDTAKVQGLKTTVPVSKELVVDVAGALVKPGVYQLPSDSRVVDALAVAGGLSADADRRWVEQNLNLSAKLQDGGKIYIPRVGERTLLPMNTKGSVTGQSSQLVNINAASEADLDNLPGVGAVTASRIVANRPYQATGDLVTKKVLGQAAFDKIKSQISVY